MLSNSAVQTSGSKSASNVQQRIDITRSSGIPIVRAGNLNDLMFAQGFITAQDRLMQMQMYKYVFSGRLSEIIGDGGVNVDKYMRMMNFSNAALSSYAEFDPEFKEALLSYANGVNFSSLKATSHC